MCEVCKCSKRKNVKNSPCYKEINGCVYTYYISIYIYILYIYIYNFFLILPTGLQHCFIFSPRHFEVSQKSKLEYPWLHSVEATLVPAGRTALRSPPACWAPILVLLPQICWNARQKTCPTLRTGMLCSWPRRSMTPLGLCDRSRRSLPAPRRRLVQPRRSLHAFCLLHLRISLSPRRPLRNFLYLFATRALHRRRIFLCLFRRLSCAKTHRVTQGLQLRRHDTIAIWRRITCLRPQCRDAATALSIGQLTAINFPRRFHRTISQR